MPRLREVMSGVRGLIDEYRRMGIPDKEIAVGFLMALQAEPLARAVEDNEKARAILQRVGGLVKEGFLLWSEVRDAGQKRS